MMKKTKSGRLGAVVWEIMRDTVLLLLWAALADLPVADDLLEAPETQKDGYVGMAVNMIDEV